MKRFLEGLVFALCGIAALVFVWIVSILFGKD